jgi:hypothetical protein
VTGAATPLPLRLRPMPEGTPGLLLSPPEPLLRIGTRLLIQRPTQTRYLAHSLRDTLPSRIAYARGQVAERPPRAAATATLCIAFRSTHSLQGTTGLITAIAASMTGVREVEASASLLQHFTDSIHWQLCAAFLSL